jgi:hypothetical protein
MGKEERGGKREEGRGKREEGRGKREEGRGKREERNLPRLYLELWPLARPEAPTSFLNRDAPQECFESFLLIIVHI